MPVIPYLKPCASELMRIVVLKATVGRFNFSAALIFLFILSGAGCGMSKQTIDYSEGYARALEYTAASSGGNEQAAERFKAFMSSLSVETVEQQADDIYAQDAYLNDNLKEVRGRDEIRSYLKKSAEGVESIRVTFNDTMSSGINWYFRWTMAVRFKSLRDGATVVTSGMTHVRFNDAGLVVLHRDFWDSATGLYEHVPGLGLAIRFVKRRL